MTKEIQLMLGGKMEQKINVPDWP